MMPYVASGLVYGALYAIAALGLVLTYKSSRVFNFAYASVAFAIAMCYYELTIVHDWPIVAAVALCLVVIAPLVGMLLTMLVFRHLRHTPVAVQVVATVGLFIAIPATVRFLFGTEPRFDAIGLFRGQPAVYDVLGTSLNLDQIAIIIGAAVIALAFGVILHATKFGLAVRTVVDNEDLAALLGISPRAVDAGTGAISAFTAGVAGILMAPVLGLNEQAFTTLLIASIAATVLGGLRSMGWTFVGAIGIGIAQGVSAKFLPATGVVSQGVRPSIPFLVIFVGLAGYSTYLAATHVSLTAVGQGLGNAIPRRGGRAYRTFWKAAVVVTLVAVVPTQLSGRWIEIWAVGLSTGIVMLSYVLITGQSQLVSLCQVTFAGIGGIVTAQLATEAGWPVLVGILAGGVVAVPVGLLIAVASVRLGALYLALSTLGFAILVDNLVFPQHRFTQLGVGVPVPRPSVFGFDLGTDVRFYFFALATFAVLALVVDNVRSSTSGLAQVAMRSAEPAAAMTGVNLLGLKSSVFALSAFIAGVGGGVLASANRVALPSAYNGVVGLLWLAAVVTFGVRRLSGALVGGIVMVALPRLFGQYLSSGWVEVPAMLFGLGAIAVAVDPGGAIDKMNTTLLELADRFRGPSTVGDDRAADDDDRSRVVERAEPEAPGHRRQPA